jgi:hypothetical protein
MKKIFFSLIFLTFLSACGGQQVYKDVFNTGKGPNVRTFNASGDTCYLAAKRAVLSQNFRVEKRGFAGKIICGSKILRRR